MSVRKATTGGTKRRAIVIPKTVTHGGRSACAVARSLDVLGDKWTLLVIRDLMYGKQRFNEFLTSPEGIPTNILADRLKRLESYGVITRRQYTDRPPRVDYLLTKMGEDLRPVLRALLAWGKQSLKRPKDLGPGANR